MVNNASYRLKQGITFEFIALSISFVFRLIRSNSCMGFTALAYIFQSLYQYYCEDRSPIKLTAFHGF